MDMALFFVKLENRTSMVGWITQITPGANAAWYSNDYRLDVGQPITAGSSVLGAIKIEPRATLSEWSLTVQFFRGAQVTVRFGAQQVNGVLQPILGAVPRPPLSSQATHFPPSGTKGDQFASVVSITDARLASGSVWTDRLATVTAERPLLRVSVANDTTSLATVDRVTQERVWEHHSSGVPSLREGVWIGADDGRGINLVTATYELVRNQPFWLEVLVAVVRPPLTHRVAIHIRAMSLAGRSWDLSHSEQSDDSLVSVGTVVAADWGIDYMVRFWPNLAQRSLENPGLPRLL